MGKLAVSKKAVDTIIIDLEDRVSYCDYFVICSAKNRRQSKSIASAIKSAIREEYATGTISIEGMESGRWVLIDLGDVVVHGFDEPLRPFYNLEGLWSDAPKVALELSDGIVNEKGSPAIP